MIYIDKTTFLQTTENENAFECDDLIAAVISILNQKGYSTQFSCEGHWEWMDDDVSSALVVIPYICFMSDIHLPSIPEGWDLEVVTEALDEDDNEIEGYWEVLRVNRLGDAESELFFNANKVKALANLVTWAECLICRI